MGGSVITVGLVAIAVALAHHLGLVGKVSEIFGEICSCCRCSVFWCVFAVMLYRRADIVVAFVSALGYAYASEWLNLLFNELSVLHTKLWQKQTQRNRKRRNR